MERRIADYLNYLKKNYEGKRVAIVAHKSPQLAIEVLTKNKTWQQAIVEDWRIKKAWQPGWEYSVEKEFKVEVKQVEIKKEEPKSIVEVKKEEPKPLLPFSIPFFGGPKPEVKEEIKPLPKPEVKPVAPAPKPKPEPKVEVKPAAPIAPAPKPEVKYVAPAPAPKEERIPFVSAAPREEKEGIEIKVGLADKLKKAVLGKIKLSKDKVEEITDELEFSLIQADVHPDVAAEVCTKIKERMSDREFARGDLENEIKEILKEVFEKEAFGENKEFDLVEKVRAGKKPYKILFVGPNGAGKTTTIAKVARMLMDAGFTVVISASDTFRAAAIEQTEEHGRRLGVRVIRQNYGADAAAVAFDAIKHAEANKIDAVLIDSAGRQDTNFNLLKELQKINRIAAPDARIFIGESIAGNSLYQQVGKFKEMIGLDGVILTKADCDAKGGTAISILRETGVPIIYLGMGQAYTDLKKFDPKYIIDNLV